MAESYGEKTEDATPRKRQEAREDGKVPRSQELTVALLLLGTALVITTVIPKMASELMTIMGASLSAAGDHTFWDGGSIKLVQMLGWRTLAVILLGSASLAVLSLAVSAIQARGVFSAKPIAPDWSRISPASNAKRIFGPKSMVEVLKAVLKICIVGFAIHGVLGQEAISAILATTQESPIGFLEAIRHYTVRLLMTAGLSYLALALADYLWQLWQFSQQLKMTKEEVKQELKNSDGDPLLKQRMRSMARSMARKQMFRDALKADVVIVNPTSRAIALRYAPDEAPAPIVLAMGQRKVAERIKLLAMEHNIPVVENRPLAVALLKHARVGMMIPADLYLAVAEVLAFVMRQRQGRYGAWARHAEGVMQHV